MLENDKLTIASTELQEKTLEIAQQIIEEDNISKVKDLTQMFNAAHIKKQVLRSMAYDNLLDHITEQMQARISQRGDQFSNKDLLDYANSVTSSLEKAQKQISGIDDVPVIQFNQQNNTVIMDALDSESQQRVENAIKSILKKIKEKPVEDGIIEDSSVYDNEIEKEPSINIDPIEFNKEGDA